MNYKEVDDEKYAGDVFFYSSTLQIFRDGFRLMAKEVAAFQDIVGDFGLDKKPYEKEKKNLDRLIEWSGKKLEGLQSYDHVSLPSITYGTLRWFKSAGLMMLRELEAKRSKILKENPKIPENIIKDIDEKISAVRKKTETGELAQLRPVDIYFDIIRFKDKALAQIGQDLKIFISYVTGEINIALFIDKLIRARTKHIEPFIAKRDIPPGSKPFQVMLEENLLKAAAIIPICSLQSLQSRWIWWETSAVWAKGGKSFPLYAGIAPEDFGEPIKTLFQGKDLFNPDDLAETFHQIFKSLDVKHSHSALNAAEIEELENLKKGMGKTNLSRAHDVEPSDLTFDKKSGIYTSLSSDLAYCTKCKIQDERLTPLREGESGWRCEVCGKLYKRPGWKPPEPEILF